MFLSGSKSPALGSASQNDSDGRSIGRTAVVRDAEVGEDCLPNFSEGPPFFLWEHFVFAQLLTDLIRHNMWINGEVGVTASFFEQFFLLI